jgi:hypothetical protein
MTTCTNTMNFESEIIDNQAIVSNIKCNKCKNVLPPHTVKQHLNENDLIHKCPHKPMNLNDPIEARAANTMKQDFIRVAKRMAYEALIKGLPSEAKLKEKDDKHVEEILKLFRIKVNFIS